MHSHPVSAPIAGTRHWRLLAREMLLLLPFLFPGNFFWSFTTWNCLQGDHKYTINITHTLPNDSRCFSPPPSLYELWVSHICSPSIIAVWRARWKAAGGERQHLQSNREEQCEISGRGSFPHARGQGIRRWGSLPQTLNTSHWHPDASSMQTHPSHVSVSRGVKLCVYPHSVTALWSACYATAVEVLLGSFAKVSPWVVDVLLKVVEGGNYCFSPLLSLYCSKQPDRCDPM